MTVNLVIIDICEPDHQPQAQMVQFQQATVHHCRVALTRSKICRFHPLPPGEMPDGHDSAHAELPVIACQIATRMMRGENSALHGAGLQAIDCGPSVRCPKIASSLQSKCGSVLDTWPAILCIEIPHHNVEQKRRSVNAKHARCRVSDFQRNLHAQFQVA